MRSGQWDPRAFMGRTLYKKTLGVVGFGSIGHLVARIAQGFEMRVIAHDPFVDSATEVELCGLERLLQEADVVTLHCALTDDTRHLIDQDALSKMKPDSVLINTARAGVIDTAALCLAVGKGKIAGAALDVFDSEPPPQDDPLCSAPNVLSTPHIAAYAQEAISEMDRMCADDLIAFFTGNKPQHPLNPEVLG
jgi:phosphoglycerate dehydrogenase-like enzyme